MDTRILASDVPPTRIGQLVLAGEVDDDEPWVPAPLRVMDAYILSFVTDGRGRYRYADGQVDPIVAGSVTIVLPGEPHWYGTAPGQRWSELFAVVTGPLFDTLAGIVGRSGPRQPRATPSPSALRTVLRASPRSPLAAEHQLMALADWLLDATAPDDGGLSPAVATATERLAEDLAGAVDLRVIAAEVGLPYDVFRRRFVAEVGQPPLAFRNGRRLQAAATLLRLTDMTLREIARTLGFTDEFHLSKRFRAHFGVPPRDYRTGRS
ncbi:AraC family transcriptional regulator [Fodinicola acaciae]|uniref:AraC family transcriptional regulator n=1 Tax=Fodinicola acaciae TaxID=2681555 RepID=UPI0013D58CF8|nr:AraC family transcriptional regulator [Fodinicola acaciae]